VISSKFKGLARNFELFKNLSYLKIIQLWEILETGKKFEVSKILSKRSEFTTFDCINNELVIGNMNHPPKTGKTLSNQLLECY